MEKRAILAFALSMVLLVVYLWVQDQFFAAPPQPQPATAPPPSPGRAPTAQAPTRTAQPALPAAPAPSAPAPAGTSPPTWPAPQPSPRPAPPQRTAVVEGPLYRGVVSSEGGKLQEWTLRYRGEKPMIVLGEQGPAGVQVGGDDARPSPVAMNLSADRVALDAAEAVRELVLTGEEAGLRVRETLRFHASDYTIDALVRIENPAPQPRQVTVLFPWSALQGWGEVTERFQGQHATEVVWSSGGNVDRVEGLTAVMEGARDGEWIAIGSVWYLAALIPRTPGFQLVTSSEKGPESTNGKTPAGRVTVGVRATPTIAAGGAWEGLVVLYVGPKEYERLRAHGLQNTINFGGFPLPRQWGGLPMDWLGVPILLLMKWVYRYVGNYGIAIILLTVISKVLFYPLTVKSIRSMKAMQTLQPQVNALRAKYKNDPQRAQREMMDLYKKHGANPLGGCLPMIAQVPIFYALYLALSVSVELQSASFFCIGRIFGVHLWICDLASQDPTYVLPVLMGATMFVQQKMTPTAGDPRQAKMMLFMPFVFTFMFLNLPSGLVLYWTVSNILQILQQWYMNRPKEGAAREAKNATRA